MKIEHLDEAVGRIIKGVNTTDDVGVGQTSIEAAKFGNKVDKDGKPPTMSKKVKGSSTNVLYNLGLAENADLEERRLKSKSYKKSLGAAKASGKKSKRKLSTKFSEGYKLQLERDQELLVLNITNTETGRRTEVRGKPGYETGGYDANDDLHQLLDQIGKSANISDLMNGEVVGINPKHPNGASAKAATDRAYNERFTALEWACIEGGHDTSDLQESKPPKDMSSIMEQLVAYDLEEALGEIASSTEIYVDMDGVLADFFGEWTKSQGVSNWKDIENPQQAIGDIKNIDDFWLKLPVLPQAKNLLNLIKKVKGSYSICTSPLADDPRSEPHKREWVKKNLAFFPPKEVIVTHDKPKWAKQKDGTPNILIDDFGVNIKNWEAAGGIGFKYKDHKFERTAKAIKHHMEEPVEENFADGKKKGKSRPGRVKKSGASCNGSVTDLRKRAKNASGEKAKMYHWCANMKSGRKKK